MNQLYKNWPAICGIKDNVMRMAVALIDLETEEGQQFAGALPNYFSETEVDGPIPLSALLRWELGWMANNEGTIAEQFRFNEVVGEFRIPFSIYRTVEGRYDFPLLPNDIDYDSLAFAKVIDWRGKKLFVAEYYPESGFMEVVLCPAERIFIDLPEYQPQEAAKA
ncbi:MAG TPA: hypothetical protein VLE93_03155 [Candidatus Saccharimonadales bacterium]|nr:hypothetical protein [Candidatus Saccharimonadales bacterium]